MPSPGEDYQSWSAAAANNGTADPLINWQEGQARASVNNSSRSEMAAHAKNRNLLNGSIVTTGSPNGQNFISGVGYTGGVPVGMVVKLKVGPGLTNTGPMWINMDGMGAEAVKTADGGDLLGGEFVSNGYVDLLFNGSNWIYLYSRDFFFERMTGGGGIIIGKQIFATVGNFTYIPSAGMECCIIECIGGGGGGGGASGQNGMTFLGGGGGSGSYSRKYATATEIGGGQVGTIGAGGSGGPPTGGGNSGGSTSVGSLCTANGGGGGGASHLAGGPSAGAGAAAGTGDLVVQGTPGGGGFWNAVNGGGIWSLDSNGAPGPFGGGATTALGDHGQQGLGVGAGGSGGSAHGLTSRNGGAGSGGAVIVTEFGGRGAPGRDGATGPIGPPGPAGPGTGDVLVSGTPAAGQIAQWVDTSHIAGVGTATIGQSVLLHTFALAGNSNANSPTGIITATYDAYEIAGSVTMTGPTNDLLALKVSIDNLGSWISSDYLFMASYLLFNLSTGVTSDTSQGSTTSTYIPLTNSLGINDAQQMSFVLRFHRLASGGQHRTCAGRSWGLTGTAQNWTDMQVTGIPLSTTAPITNILLQSSNGNNFGSNSWAKLYGLK